MRRWLAKRDLLSLRPGRPPKRQPQTRLTKLTKKHLACQHALTIYRTEVCDKGKVGSVAAKRAITMMAGCECSECMSQTLRGAGFAVSRHSLEVWDELGRASRAWRVLGRHILSCFGATSYVSQSSRFVVSSKLLETGLTGFLALKVCCLNGQHFLVPFRPTLKQLSGLKHVCGLKPMRLSMWASVIEGT